MLDFLLPRRGASNEDRWGPGWLPIGGRKTTSGVSVDEEVALTLASCWCATRIICETESSLPLFTYKRITTDEGSGRAGDTMHAGDYYLYDLLKSRPNPDMGSMAFREGRTLHQVNYGNGFAEIEWDADRPELRTKVVALWPIHPSRVKAVDSIRQADLWQQGYRYLVKNDDKTAVALKPDEMLHIPGVLTEDGIWGKGVVAYHRETIGMGLGIREHGASYFGSGGQPPAVIFTSGLKDREARKNFRTEWKEIHGTLGSNEVAILPTDAKYEKLTYTNEDGQYLETAKLNISDIARIYRIPVYMLEEYEKAASFASVEQRSIDFVVGFMAWLVRWEEQCDLKLILPQDRATYFVEHNVSGLLRGDFDSRMKGYTQALQNGIMTINEVRRLENLNSIGSAGDVHYVQMNMTTAELMMAGPQPTDQAGRAGAGLTDGSLAFDGWTREMVAKGHEVASVKLLGRNDSRKAAMTMPAAATPSYMLTPMQPDAEADEPEILDVPDVRQTENFDCGACATRIVAEYFGVGGGRDEAAYIAELGTTPEEGTSPDAIIDWLNDAGLITTSGPGMTLDDLEKFFEAGQPVIVPVQMYGATEAYDTEERDNQTGHYVVVIGVGMGIVVVADPVAGRQMLPAADFLERWHDVESDGVVDVRFGIAVGQKVIEPEPCPPCPEPAAPGIPNSATRLVLADGYGRVLTKLANALRREAATVLDVAAWVDTFIAEHRETLEANLAPAAAVVNEAAGVMLARLMNAAKKDLVRAFDDLTRPKLAEHLATWPRELADRFAGETSGTQTRVADRLMDKILALRFSGRN